MDEPTSRSRSLWARFAAQETGPQKVLLAVAAIVAAVATIVGAGAGIYQLVDGLLEDGSSSAGDLTSRDGQTLVEQGSPEADDLVRAFVEADGQRVELDVMVVAQARDPNPQWIFRLWYNCQGLDEGDPPGADLCDEAAFVFDNQEPPPPRYSRPNRVELTGTWADSVPSSLAYGADGLQFYPVRVS